MARPTDIDGPAMKSVGDENNRLGSRPTEATSAAIRHKSFLAFGGIFAGGLADLSRADESLFRGHGFHCAAVIGAIGCHGWPVEIAGKADGPAGAAII